MLIDVDNAFGSFGLSDSCTGVIIVSWPTGVKYTSQVGGMLCLHPEYEGFALVSPFEIPFLHDDCPDLCYGGRQHDKQDEWAKKIDAALKEKDHLGISARFDFSRVRELMEGWWPILVTAKEYQWPDITPFAERPAILCTGANCD